MTLVEVRTRETGLQHNADFNHNGNSVESSWQQVLEYGGTNSVKKIMGNNSTLTQTLVSFHKTTGCGTRADCNIAGCEPCPL